MNILITGGTGSFGQAFAKHALINNLYSKIIIFSRDEHKQEKMEKELKELDIHNRMRYLIGDIRDKYRLSLALMEAHYVVHAAALKRVPNAEYEPLEYIKTNIIGTQNLIECCLSTYGRGSHLKVLALSTDKAVAPINLYGATKLCMEKMMLAANNIHGENGPRFSIVRYGNVANSNGSVIQVFKKCREKNLSMPVTSKEMTRFWITLDEAVEFVNQKLTQMAGKEIFIPDMPSFNILDLAYTMATNYLEAIKIIGVREGEKLHEQIDENKHSNLNDRWLGMDELKIKLREMGVL